MARRAVYTDEHELFRETVAEFVRREILPRREEIRAPGQPEPLSHYTDAVRVEGPLLFVSGVVPVDGHGRLVGGDDVVAQAEQVFANMREVLAAAGATFADVIKVTLFLTDVDDRPRINGVRERVFGPTSSRREIGDSACRVRWKRLGLEILFTSFDAPGPSRCRGTIGLAQSFKVRGKRFRTWHGLRVGQREAAVKRRHPDAKFRQGSWWLSSAVNPMYSRRPAYWKSCSSPTPVTSAGSISGPSVSATIASRPLKR